MIAEEGEYKGQPMLILKNNENDKYPFQFGLKKAKMILEAMDDIQAFVEAHDKSENPPY